MVRGYILVKALTDRLAPLLIRQQKHMHILKIIEDIAAIGAACTASYVALVGLNAWKKQLKGKTDYELARRYLRSVYKVRDAIKDVRNPFIPAAEITSALKDSGLSESDYSERKNYNAAVYSARWKKVTEAGTDVSVELLEAEVSWGKEAIEVQKDFDSSIRKLFANLKLFVDGHFLDEQRDIIYDRGDGDIFTQELNKGIQKIEEYLKPHLK